MEVGPSQTLKIVHKRDWRRSHILPRTRLATLSVATCLELDWVAHLTTVCQEEKCYHIYWRYGMRNIWWTSLKTFITCPSSQKVIYIFSLSQSQYTTSFSTGATSKSYPFFAPNSKFRILGWLILYTSGLMCFFIDMKANEVKKEKLSAIHIAKLQQWNGNRITIIENHIWKCSGLWQT